MKKILQSFTMILMLFFVFSNAGIAQELQLLKTGGAPVVAEFDKDEDGEWIYWDSGVNEGNSIGTDAAAQFSIAHRWEPADIAPYDGMHVTMIRFFPRYQDATYTVTIWTGPDAGEVYSQEVETFVNEDWNEIELDTPFEIDGSEDLWYGVHIDTQGGFPAGCDAGPPVAGKGNMMFWEGNWVELTDLNPDLTFNWNLGAFVTDEAPDPGETYSVTFNVDMGGAIAEGDVAFDPEIHSVFVTGTFADWITPGEDDAFELHPAENGAKNEDTFYENWDGYEDFTTDLSPWINIDEHENPTWAAGDFDFPGEAEAFGWRVMNPAETDPAIDGTHPAFEGDKYIFSVASNPVPPTGEENKWLISPAMEVTADSELSFAAKSITAEYGLERFIVYVSTTGTDVEDFEQISDGSYIEVPTEWTEYSFDLGGYAGETIHFAVENVSEDSFMLFMDAFEVTNLGEGEPVEEDIYTITLDVEGGDHEYKYFLVEDEPTWDLGEWEGDPNREITVDGDMVFNDIWGEEPVSVEEIELVENEVVLFPNPAIDNLTVVSEQMIKDIRIFDISGRMLMSVDVMDHTVEVEVSSFNNGLYIMQVNTEDGVKGYKFHVAR